MSLGDEGDFTVNGSESSLFFASKLSSAGSDALERAMAVSKSSHKLLKTAQVRIVVEGGVVLQAGAKGPGRPAAAAPRASSRWPR